MTGVVRIPKWLLFVLLACVAMSISAAAFGLVAGRKQVRPLEPALVRHADTLSLAFRQAADFIAPSVVSITSEQQVTASRRGDPFGQQFPEQFRQFFGEDFERFFDAPGRRGSVRRGFGSGVIVSSDGFVLTNNHVVAGADRVTVRTVDGESHAAEVIGRDPKSEVAVIKIEAAGLTAARLADSDEAYVGDWVIAVGGPFGLQNTVTAGIVSATGRNAVGIADYENFIQTDAAINPGNSGGPLVNLHGEVVGINTAIATRSGSNSGVGFSIPVNMAREIMTSLREHGHVERGYMGAIIQNLSKELADSFSFRGEHGVLIGDVAPNGPAEKVGLRSGDIVTKLNGKATESSSQLRNSIAATKPGTTVTLEIFRDGRLSTFKLKVGLLNDRHGAGRGGDAESPENLVLATDLGLTVRTLTEELAEELGYDTAQRGVVVTSVDPGGLAASVGLQRRDIITSVNNQNVADTARFQEAVKNSDLGRGIRLQINRNGFSSYIFLRAR